MDRGAVISRFTVTSAFMWALPLLVLLAFNQKQFTDLIGIPEEHTTLFSGLTAVLAVNVVMAVYIVMALRDAPTASQPQPDPAFVAAAQRSIEPTAGDAEREQLRQRRSRSKRD